MVTLVLLPGMDGTGELFAPFLAKLGPEFSVKVVRYPTNEPLGYAELEAVVRSELPPEGPFVILGESFSGPIAVSLAASGLPRLKGLVLCCTFVRNPRPIFGGLRSLLAVVPVTAVPGALLSWLLMGRFSSAALRSAFAKAVAQVSSSVLRARLRSVLAVDVSAHLRGATIPTLYLRASRDRVVPAGAARLVSRLKPDTCIAEVEAPHFLLQAAPSEAARLVRAFLHEVQCGHVRE
jgi:pimeloyl-ACP methyl ester carboxylesterase